MTDKVSASIDIAASPATVWQLVTDVPRMPEFSPELRHARWLSQAAEPRVGARFKGTNKHGVSRWSTSCQVTTADPEREFAYRVTYLGLKVSDWSYEIEPTADGCRLTESTIDRRSVFMKYTSGPATGVLDRPAHNHAGITATLAAIKAAAEKDSVTA